MHPSFETIGKGPFSSAPSVDLSFYDDSLSVCKRRKSLVDLICGLGNRTTGYGYTCVRKKLLGLVFVYIHEYKRGKACQGSFIIQAFSSILSTGSTAFTISEPE